MPQLTLPVLALVVVAIIATALVLATIGASAALLILALIAGLLAYAVAEPVRDGIAGRLLRHERGLEAGDLVAFDGSETTIRSIGLLSTELDHMDGGRLIVGNARLLGAPIVKLAGPTEPQPFAVRLAVSRNSEPDRVRAVLTAAVAGHPSVVMDPEPEVHLEGFEDGMLLLTLRFLMRRAASRPRLRSEINTRIYEALAASGIEIPRSQSDIYLRDLDGVRHAFARALALRAKARASNEDATAQGGAETRDESKRDESEQVDR